MSISEKISSLYDLIKPIDKLVAEDIRIIAKEVEDLAAQLAAKTAAIAELKSANFDVKGEAMRQAVRADTAQGELAAQKSENANLLAANKDLSKNFDALMVDYEAARKDAERLDYIQKHARCDPKIDGKHVWWPTIFKHRLVGATIRTAIDAAIAAQLTAKK